MKPTRAFELALALDGSVMVITWSERENGRTLCSATTPCDGTAESIVVAMEELARRAPLARRVVATLCRPLAQSRIVPLPRMPRTTVERVLARDWTRHVIGFRATPHDVAAREVARHRWSSAFAPSSVLDALTAGAEEQGWRDFEIRTSDDALASIARGPASASNGAPAEFVVVCEDGMPTDAVYAPNGDPLLGRRFPGDASDDDVVAFIDAAVADTVSAQRQRTVVVLGDGAPASTLVRSLVSRGHRAKVADLDLPAGPPMALIAAASMLQRARLPLSAAVTRDRVARSVRRLTWRLAFATVAALVAAFLLARWDVSRRLADVRQRRADISGAVRRAIATRAEMEGAADVATVLADREAHASRASEAAAAIALALPHGASLTVLSVSGDSVLIEGESPQSAVVYAALGRVPTLERIQSAAPLRQERQADSVIGRFAFSARLRASPTLRVRTP
ncbi:MAG: hypothetical protein JWL95_278 [Gemmatimonadetes bacterium]|nr:hypothetical protein [Gemmatimonadota bacterium]